MNQFKSVIPVILGAELNAYSIARAFSEECGAVSQSFGKYPLGFTSHSRIVNFGKMPMSEDVLISALVDFARMHMEAELYLFACTDEYAEMIIRNKALLSEHYFCPYPDEKTASALESKADFYNICEKYSIPYPKTEVFEKDTNPEKLRHLGFDFPVIIKPSRSSVYWKHPFPEMKKVYSASSPREAEAIIGTIFSSGYPERIIVQDKIPGNDSKMYVMTSYSGTDGKVRRMCLGHVLLEEHTPKGLGNHAAVITEYQPEITEILRIFLDEIGYVGFANFDMKLDLRDGKFKVFEINLRQGRSNYYVTAAGQSLARTVIGDRHGSLSDVEICRKESFWHTVPKRIVFSYIEDNDLTLRAEHAAKIRSSSTLFYKKDMWDPLRFFYICVHNLKYFGKYKKYGEV